MNDDRARSTSAWGNPGVRLAAALSALWLLSWLLVWCAADAVGPLGLPWLTWSHIALGAAAVVGTVWAVGALGRWEDGSSTRLK